MNAEPTITPSAYAATDCACARVDTPRPTHTGSAVTARTRFTKSRASTETLYPAPVTPMTLAA